MGCGWFPSWRVSRCTRTLPDICYIDALPISVAPLGVGLRCGFTACRHDSLLPFLPTRLQSLSVGLVTPCGALQPGGWCVSSIKSRDPCLGLCSVSDQAVVKLAGDDQRAAAMLAALKQFRYAVQTRCMLPCTLATAATVWRGLKKRSGKALACSNISAQ